MLREIVFATLLCLFSPDVAVAATFNGNSKPEVGMRVTFVDRTRRFGGGTVSGTIIKDRGSNYEYASRWEVKVDGHEETKNCDAWEFDAEHGGTMGAPGANQAKVAAPDQAVPHGQAAPPVVPAGGGRDGAAPVAKAPVPAGAAHGRDDWGRIPQPGNFRYGKMNPSPMLGDKAITPPGLKPFFVGSKPGNESCVGRWYTKTGGVWTKSGGPDYSGNQTYTWGKPESAETINVMADGTWQMNNFGKVTSGKWYDIGQNVIRLVEMTPGEDWTASVYDHMIQFKGYNGITKEGNRY